MFLPIYRFFTTRKTINMLLRNYLLDNAPEYIEVVPDYWLGQDEPERNIQICISIIFLIISLTGNTCQILVILAYAR